MRKLKATKRTAKYRIQVLERAFDILDELAANSASPGLAELSAGTGLHKSTALRILSVLETRRYVERSPSGSEFRLGLRLFELGSRAVARINAVEIARPFLERLVEESGETAHLGILRQGEIVSISNVESHQTLRTPATVGKRSPLHCSSQGKCILAFLPENTVTNLYRGRALEAFTPKTITSLDVLRRRLEHTCAHGYALDDEEFETGLRCVGAPVRDHSGQVVAAISIAGPAFRLTRDRLPALIRLVKQTATELSGALGYSPGSAT